MKYEIFFYIFLIFISIILKNSFGQKLNVVTENWKPYNYFNKKKIKAEGVATSIIKKVLDHAKISYSIKFYSWNKAYKLAQTQENVMIYTIIAIPARKNLFTWIRPLGKAGVSKLYRLKNPKNITFLNIDPAKSFNLKKQNYVDYRQYGVITNLNSMDHIWLKNNGFKKILVLNSVENAAKEFFRERSPLIAFNSTNLEYELKRLSPKKIIPIVALFKSIPYMALSKQTSLSLARKIARAYDELSLKGKIESSGFSKVEWEINTDMH